MKLLYFFRVLLLSFEAAVIVLAALLHFGFGDSLGHLARKLQVDEELRKWLVLAPVGLLIWIVNESRQLLQEDKDAIRTLTGWPDYWRLKVHVAVGLIYATVFTMGAALPWLSKEALQTGVGMLMFTTGLVGDLVVAASVYVARIRLRELLA